MSETFNTLLRGQIQCDLMPLLDGRRSHAEIAAALAPAHSASEVRAAITALASRGYLVSGDHRMAPGPAAYWTSLGASPRWAEQRLETATVDVAGDAGSLAGRLETLGVRVDAARPSVSVVVCADYLEDRHDAINRRHLESGTPWVLVRPGGMQPLFGPVFRPAGDQHPPEREYEDPGRDTSPSIKPPPTKGSELTLRSAVPGSAATEFARRVASGCHARSDGSHQPGSGIVSARVAVAGV